MATDFFDKMQDILTNGENNISVTENGAIGYRTTGTKLLDLNFAVSSLRNETDLAVTTKFADACAEGVDLAIVWLFFARDVRGGMGERRLFRVCMKYLAREFPNKVKKVLPLIEEYGRWDDLLELLDTPVKADVEAIIQAQLAEDLEGMENQKSVSLLAKWMPSANASSKQRRIQASQLQKAFGLPSKSYRVMLSALRKYISVIERQMSEGMWDKINYEAVPSRANLIYNDAFLRHDEDRRREYLGKLEKGEAKINASTLFPHDVVHKYGRYANKTDPAIEAMWKALPNMVDGDNGGTIVVADGSGSMFSPIDQKSKVHVIDVANALAIYFAEKLSGTYKNKYITFSNSPQLVNLAGATTLLGKLNIALEHDEVSDTNIEAVFNLILDTAIKNHLKQEDVPKNILIISDMEFNGAVTCGNGYASPNKQLFQVISEKYKSHGYLLPRVVFWNVGSSTGTIPLIKNELGVSLVSGFSPNIAKMVMSSKFDPMEALMETLNSPRYASVVASLEALEA